MIKKRCFVISPIGAEGSTIRHHADDVVEFIIEKALKKFKDLFSIEIEAIRADQIDHIGMITRQMFDEILHADLCIAILTDHNPNVFYELAVAQAAARPVIILIESPQSLPFDVRDTRSVSYQFQPVKDLIRGVYSDAVFEQLQRLHEEGWDAQGLFQTYGYGPQLGYEKILQSFIADARPETLPVGKDSRYALPSDPKRTITFVTGDVKEIGDFGADVIVSLESTNLQLARYYDPWLSGTLRYLDAEKTPGGGILRDTLQMQLQEEIQALEMTPPFPTGTVVATPTNQLSSIGIKYVFHIAAMQGAVGDGYHTLEQSLDDCIRNVFGQFEHLAQERPDIRTILFPLLGAGSTELDYVELSRKMLENVMTNMDDVPACTGSFLLAWIGPHLYALRRAAKELGLQELPLDS